MNSAFLTRFLRLRQLYQKSLSRMEREKSLLHPEQILLLEFDHASKAAIQTQQERISSMNEYYVLLGVVISALGILYQLDRAGYPFALPVAIPLLLIGGVVSSSFFARFKRLHKIYQDSLISMDKIKRFYIQHCQQPANLETAFNWNSKNIRATAYLVTPTLFVCCITATICALSLGLASFLSINLEIRTNPNSPLHFLDGVPAYLLAGTVIAFILLLHLIRYRHAYKILD